jgi:hypothetical protein
VGDTNTYNPTTTLGQSAPAVLLNTFVSVTSTEPLTTNAAPPPPSAQHKSSNGQIAQNSDALLARLPEIVVALIATKPAEYRHPPVPAIFGNDKHTSKSRTNATSYAPAVLFVTTDWINSSVADNTCKPPPKPATSKQQEYIKAATKKHVLLARLSVTVVRLSVIKADAPNRNSPPPLAIAMTRNI